MASTQEIIMDGRQTTRNLMHLNNVGVAFLESGDVYQSRQLFLLATKMLKLSIDHELTKRPRPTEYIGSQDDLFSPCSRRAVGFPGERNSSSLYDFLRPVYFSQDIIRSSNPPLVKLCISLLFNLALSNHAIAIQEVTPATSTSTEDAIFLYQLAYGLQHGGGIELSWLHTMGMINNVGKLLAHVGVREESQKCFQHLLNHLMLQVDKSRGEEQGARLVEVNKEQIARFLDNILEMVLHNYSISSPAA